VFFLLFSKIPLTKKGQKENKVFDKIGPVRGNPNQWGDGPIARLIKRVVHLNAGLLVY
jgi:hypothetical protein